MAAPTEIYIDPAIAADSGTGVIGDPYGDLQFALNSVTRDATNGNRFNIKAGTDEILGAAISLATYGTPTNVAPLIFQGYTSAAGDGGQGGISGAGSFAVISTTALGIYFVDLHLHNCGSAAVLTLTNGFCQVIRCEINNTTGSAIVSSAGDLLWVIGCNIYNIGAVGVNAISAQIFGNYFANSTNDFTDVITLTGTNRAKIISHNIFNLDGTTDAIVITGRTASTGYQNLVAHNSIYTTGSGIGIEVTNDVGSLDVSILNNLLEGWTTGIELDDATTRTIFSCLGNAGYDNSTDFDLGDHVAHSSNESLGATPFAKSGAATYANRNTYFKPVSTGSVLSPFGGLTGAKGAVQPSAGGTTGRQGLQAIEAGAA